MSSVRKLPSRKHIALVAHDNKKQDLIEWVKLNKNTLSKHHLLATGSTGELIENELKTKVEKLLSGPLGGDQQIGAMIAEGKINVLIFFWDTMKAQPHDSDVKALMRIAVTWNVIIACNLSTADFITGSLLMDTEYEAAINDFEEYS